MHDAQRRWRQRYSSFERALALLSEALEAKPLEAYSRLEQEGIVQRFEYSFELAWKTLKDLLYFEGYDEKTPRSVIRRAFAVGWISEEDAACWLDSLDKRNLLSHTYNEQMAQEALVLIRDRYYPLLQRLQTFLRAKMADDG